MKAQERALQKEISKCLEDIQQCKATLNRNYCDGVALSSPIMVGLGIKLTGLETRLSELDRQHEELILNTV